MGPAGDLGFLPRAGASLEQEGVDDHGARSTVRGGLRLHQGERADRRGPGQRGSLGEASHPRGEKFSNGEDAISREKQRTAPSFFDDREDASGGREGWKDRPPGMSATEATATNEALAREIMISELGDYGTLCVSVCVLVGYV